jgi:hypothetical protein
MLHESLGCNREVYPRYVNRTKNHRRRRENVFLYSPDPFPIRQIQDCLEYLPTVSDACYLAISS